jgi:hypothetical protein
MSARVTRRRSAGRVGALIVLTTLLALVFAPAAIAARKAHPGERRAVQHVALAYCRHQGGGPCYKASVIVSTVNAHYAKGGADNDGFAGVIAKRKGKHWHVVAALPSDVPFCSQYRKVAPHAVLKDLKIEGYLTHSTQSKVGYC